MSGTSEVQPEFPVVDTLTLAIHAGKRCLKAVILGVCGGGDAAQHPLAVRTGKTL